MNDIVIRSMNYSDLNDALKIWENAFNSGFSSGFDNLDILKKYLERNPEMSSAAFDNSGKMIGALMCGHDGRRGSIYHTAVIDEYRGKGIGTRMEERSLRQLRKHGITTGFLFVNIKNPGSKKFWNSIGWEIIEDVKYLYKEF